MSNIKRLRMPILISALTHFLVFLIFGYLAENFQFSPPVSEPKSPPIIKIRSIDQSEMKKYRQVGVKNGKKDFSLKVEQKTPVTKKVPITRPSLQELGQVSKSNTQSQGPSNTVKELGQVELGKKNVSDIKTKSAIENRIHQARMQRDMLSNLAPNSPEAHLVNKNSFNIHFEPPEGVSEDELNSSEKIFYSFQKRTFTSYVNSFLKTYNEVLLKKPFINNVLNNEEHLLTGKITFDYEGNITKIRIFRSSTNDDLHALFEETLKEIRSLPNPPKDLVKNKKTFDIYYQLNINR